MGESGSGKTTVALALLGHARRGLSIAGGEINLDGRNLLTLGPAALRAVRGAKVAYVPQDPSAALNPTLRIGLQLREILAYHPGVVDDVDARAIRGSPRAQLDPEGDFSTVPSPALRWPATARRTGHRLRLQTFPHRARRTHNGPRCLNAAGGVGDRPRSLCRLHGVAAVYVSHDLAVVGGIVSQVAVMYAGRIIELGEHGQVFTSPAHPYTKGLLQAVPSPHRTELLVAMKGQPPVRPPLEGMLVCPSLPLCRETLYRRGTSSGCRRRTAVAMPESRRDR